jgi:hypothetical protein
MLSSVTLLPVGLVTTADSEELIPSIIRQKNRNDFQIVIQCVSELLTLFLLLIEYIFIFMEYYRA